MDDNNKKDNRRKNLEHNSHKKHQSKFSDEDQKFIQKSKKAFKLKKRSLIEDELLDEIEDYDY